MRDFLHTEVTIPDTLPKDELLQLQQIQTEMTLGLESRQGALKRLGREDIENKIDEIDEDREKNPQLYGQTEQPQLNSGMTNGQTPQEVVNTEMNGANVENPDGNNQIS